MSHILDPLTFPLHGSRLIEASAGTGKTYTIAALFVRLVLKHGQTGEQGQPATAFERALQPKQILVMTFTRAATAELADRIRARLSEAATYFRHTDHDSSDKFLLELKQDCLATAGAGALSTYARQLELAAQSMDEASVSTIHGWCQKMLTEHAFASGSLFDQDVETDEEELQLAAAEDYFRHFVYGLAPELAEQVLAILDTPERLLRKVGRQLIDSQQGSSTANFPSLVDTYRQAESENLAAVTDYRDKYRTIAARVYEAIMALPDSGNKGRKNAAQALHAWVTGEVAQLSLGSDLKYLKPADIEKKLAGAAPDGLAILSELPADYAALKGLSAKFESMVLLHARDYLHGRINELKLRAAVMGHNDMLTRLRDALRGPNGADLAATIRQQYPIALVDEFQDTDPIQYEIFDRIYGIADNDVSTGIFLIGDPKQAIYSFRNADIFTYLQAREATAGRHYTLATNFRSSHNMVAAINDLFARSENNSERGAFLYPDIPFQPVAANGQKLEFRGLDGEPAAALQWQIGSEPVKTKGDYQRPAANYHANLIAQLLNSERAGFYQQDGQRTAVQPSDIAVLVGNASEARLIRRELSLRGIRSVYLSESDSVYAQAVAKDLLLIIQACAQPRDPQRVRAAIACRLLQLPLAELVLLQEDEQRWEAMVDRFDGYHQLWEKRGVLALLHRILHEFAVPKYLLANQRDGERQLADVLHIAELLQQASAALDGMASLEDYFAEQVHEFSYSGGFGSSGKRTNAESLQLRLESDQALVKVVTYHKSKGLQYPLVFMPFAAYTTTEQHRIRFPKSYHDEQRQRQVAWDKSNADAVQRISDEILAEDLRKMYVALTRAEFATFVTLQAVGDPNVNPLFYLLYGAGDKRKVADYTAVFTDAEAAWKQVHTAIQSMPYETRISYSAPVPSAQNLQAAKLPQDHRLERWWLASYSALQAGVEMHAPQTTLEMNVLEETRAADVAQGDETETTAMPEQRPEFADHIHILPKGAGPGTFLHNILEDVAERGFAEVAHDEQARMELIQRRCRSDFWQPYAQQLQEWLGVYLQSDFPLSAEGSCVRLADLTVYKAEPEFWFPAHGVDVLQLDQLVASQIQPQFARPKLEKNILNGMLKGFIDLVFEYQGKYYVADYKSNWLGEDDSAYHFAALREKILASRYDMQYVIYTYALHKLLQVRLGANYRYEEHVGGVVYLFLRGHRADSRGAFYDQVPFALIEQLDELFMGSSEPVAFNSGSVHSNEQEVAHD
ncbi:MAG: exodeoxyribonuclease V subunit beta [Aliidiomarina sp.]|uniref:exodeoxyribonuclease V subunit beta n=1 Tax=Aliidiomarina sp. TaxID=1872439 RepID=UPI0025BE33AC|nr:exodeoxyribonuclease V subunit beta [Aliidiomarina sp.]MCH8500798.1 exodeoxyribonuclease V subunit beta [Aliidiomarina sp.]